MPSAKVKALALLLVLFGLGQHVQLGSAQAAGLVDRYDFELVCFF